MRDPEAPKNTYRCDNKNYDQKIRPINWSPPSTLNGHLVVVLRNA